MGMKIFPMARHHALFTLKRLADTIVLYFGGALS